MNFIEAILLGIIQGATEFLPISSSGHLLLVPSLFGLAEPNLNAIAVAHLGTLLAVSVYFRSELLGIFRSLLRDLVDRQPMAHSESRLGWYIAAGTVPALIAGLLFKDAVEEVLETPPIAAVLLLLNALILLAAERAARPVNKELSRMGWGDAFTIGLAQVFALLPGISRSGSTISAALARGFDRETAARFSFLLGVPAIAGAGTLALVDLIRAGSLVDQAGLLAASFASAFLVGIACIHFLLSWLRRHTLLPFVFYCALFGLSYLVVTWAR